ncbi:MULTISPECIES: hypothetical protein [unclassified Paenibacillus]|uniref:hypothetical protein n=1 Tax=unclassified Paenibacillus TaxID=185978 RepID=UPI001642EB05|nr:hypothetical protein [Paenibacillus sp. Y412MC10]
MKKLKLLLWITMATTGLEMMGFAMNESAQAAAGPPSVAVQNAEWNQGHLLVPVRPLIEPLGARLEWFPAEKELVIAKTILPFGWLQISSGPSWTPHREENFLNIRTCRIASMPIWELPSKC